MKQDNLIHYRNTNVDGLNIFYREAGSPSSPAILLLHGFPTSSFMYRNLIPLLATHYHVIAPDLPGFGYSDAPSVKTFRYTFDNLSNIIQGFCDTLRIERYGLYVFDYGAPIGFRLALRNPDKILFIISQNGNAYEEGLSDNWELIRRYWSSPTQGNRDALKKFMKLDITIWQYEEGVTDKSLISPDSYTLDQHFLDRPGNIDIQLDLLKDYSSNLKLYPQIQAYFRKRKPRLLVVWGSKDPYFLPEGAKAYKRDNPNAVIKFYETGHFALETHLEDIGNEILAFLRE